MIRKAFLTMLILFAGYTVFVGRFAPTWWHASQHQWQDNVIKAETFVYASHDTFKNLIVGSSLSCRLIMAGLPGTYNLSFGGQSVFDGLRILSQKPNPPKNVFIETNMALRPESVDFTDGVFSPVMYYPRMYLPSLRRDVQPIAGLGVFSVKVINKVSSKLTSPAPNRPVITPGASEDFFQKNFGIQVKNFSQPPSQKDMTVAFTKLKNYVDDLRSKGVSVVFFEMPVHPEVQNSPLADTLRKAFTTHFPRTQYRHIPPPEGIAFKTSDGIHLGFEEACRYTDYFREQMETVAR